MIMVVFSKKCRQYSDHKENIVLPRMLSETKNNSLAFNIFTIANVAASEILIFFLTVVKRSHAPKNLRIIIIFRNSHYMDNCL